MTVLVSVVVGALSGAGAGWARRQARPVWLGASLVSFVAVAVVLWRVNDGSAFPWLGIGVVLFVAAYVVGDVRWGSRRRARSPER